MPGLRAVTLPPPLQGIDMTGAKTSTAVVRASAEDFLPVKAAARVSDSADPGSGATATPGETAAAIAAEKTRVLLANAGGTLFANLLNGLILAAALTTSTLPLALVAVWTMILLLCVFMRISVMRAWKRKITAPETWLKWFTASSAIMGIAWGAVGVFLFFHLDQVYAALIIFILAGMTAGAAATNGVHVRAAVAFAIPVLAPVLVYFASLGTVVGAAMAVLVAIFFAMMIKVARTAEQALTTGVALTAEKSALADNLQETVDELTKSQLQLEENAEELHRLATTDPLTGALNRRQFFELLKTEVYRAERYDRAVALAAFDIDHFKQINDTHGHAAGDECLRSFVNTIRSVIRESDIFARFGGEEFILVLPETEIADALQLCERLRANVAEQSVEYKGATIDFTVSVGVTAIEPREYDLDRPLARADAALYSAKHGGRNAVQFNPAVSPGGGLHRQVS